jgi:NAD(P)-dependent dehydrogenase (short-subunit alcohol dehydrogenase family)
MLLQNKIAIVTGGTSGIGAAITEELAGAGAHVVFCGRNDAAARALAARIEGEGGAVRYLLGDIADAGFPDRLAKDVMSQEGRIDVLVNNAGILFRGTVETCTDQEWEATFAVNVTGLFRMSRAVIAPMRQAGGGVISSTSLPTGRWWPLTTPPPMAPARVPSPNSPVPWPSITRATASG